MARIFRRHLTYANVTATLALVLAMAGGAYATTHLSKNSVGAKQLKKNAVTHPKIKSGAVDGSTVKDDSLTGADILESSLARVPSAASAASANNASALGGKPAAAYASNVVYRSKTLNAIDGDVAGTSNDGGADDGTVTCATGEHAIGGGVYNPLAPDDEYLISSRPAVGDLGTPSQGGTADGWRGIVGDSGAITGAGTFTVYAVCAG